MDRSITIHMASRFAQIDGEPSSVPLEGPRALISVHPIAMGRRGTAPPSANCMLLTRGGHLYAQETEDEVRDLLESARDLQPEVA